MYAEFYGCLVILTAVNAQDVFPHKHKEQQNISPLSFRFGFRWSPWIFLLFTGTFPSFICEIISVVWVYARIDLFPPPPMPFFIFVVGYSDTTV